MAGGSAAHRRPPAAPIAERIELLPGERLVATARFDLDRDLRFTEGWLALTDRRLLGDTPASADGATTSPDGLHAWLLDDASCLDVRVRGGVGRVELSRAGQVLARWLFTPAPQEQQQREAGNHDDECGQEDPDWIHAARAGG